MRSTKPGDESSSASMRATSISSCARERAPPSFRVLVDGAAPGAAHGLDVDEEGWGTLVQPRLYQLVREPGTITDRTLEVASFDPGVEAYVFTFG